MRKVEKDIHRTIRLDTNASLICESGRPDCFGLPLILFACLPAKQQKERFAIAGGV